VRHMIPTLVVEERTLLREGLTSLLDQTHYSVIAAAARVSDVDFTAQPEQPALVVYGFSSGMDETITGIRHLRQKLPAAKVFVVAEGSDRCDSQEIIHHGADGCILNVRSQEVLLKSLDLTLLQQSLVVVGHPGQSDRHATPAPLRSDEPSANRSVSGGIAGSSDVGKLSGRERQILACLARGDTNKSIAIACCITEATVKVHLKAILRKIGVHNRTQAAIRAIEGGLVINDLPSEPVTSPPQLYVAS